jgi:peptide/nickel transport system substrate-binding protein
MEETPERALSQSRVRGSRGLSTVTAAVVMIVVIIVVGAGAYVAFSRAGYSTSSSTSCTPRSAAVCAQFTNTHDLRVLAPFKSAQAGNTIPFTAILPSGGTSSSYTFNFGDGTKPVSSSASTVDHAFTSPGSYIVQASAVVGGVTHDNLHALVLVTISANAAAPDTGTVPGVSGTVVSNSTSSAAPTGILQTGQHLTVKGDYISAPTNPSFVLAPPRLTQSGGTPSGVSNTSASATETVTFPTAGTYQISFVGTARSGSTVATQNYTWTVVVAPSGLNGGTSGTAVATDPHKNTIIYYNEAPGGATSLDPAIAYDTVSYEPILNVYQGLIAYNGSSSGPNPSDFVPVLATCVPGSAQCAHLYGGNSLQSGYNYTFVIDSHAQFYDPHTGAHWGVYPSDVVFSVARTMGFADLPAAGAHNGWILTQSLLPAGTSGIHYPYNNTPQNIFASMSVNDTSAGCPLSAMTTAHGCVTFHANGLGEPWPYELELLGDQLGASVVSCGWVSGTAATSGQQGIPYWTTGPGATAPVTGTGDHPCLLPGGATSTTQPSFISAVAAIPSTGWDSWEMTNAGTTPTGRMTFDMVGSGPYYLSDYRIGTSYALKANPDYAQNPECTWTGCEPAPGAYAANIQETWESTATPGEQAFAAGIADLATIPPPDTGLALQLIEAGKIQATSYPSISIFFHPYDMSFNVKAAQAYIPSPITVPGDFMSYLGMRQFLNHAFPYTTVENTVNTRDGIQFGFNYGGVIPTYMAYSPTNIAWPSGDPCTDSSNPNCPAYWWAQMHSSSSPYYDPEVAACTASAPCSWPLFGETGAPAEDQALALWSSSVQSLSGGAIVPHPVDITFTDLVIGSLFAAPGTEAFPLYVLGWAPDYPDPTDYVGPMWAKDSTYTYGDSVWETLNCNGATPCAFNQTGCSTDFAVYAAMTTAVPQKCQGAAYAAMQNAIRLAAVAPAGPGRATLYDQISEIANQLSLYQYEFQSNSVWYYASWINGATINSNVVIGGGGDNTWWSIGGNGVY